MGENLQTQGAEQASIGSCRRRVSDHAGVFLTTLSTGPVPGAVGLQMNKPYALCWSHGGAGGGALKGTKTDRLTAPVCLGSSA